MKKNLFALIVLICSLGMFSSCSKDENPGEPLKYSLVMKPAAAGEEPQVDMLCNVKFPNGTYTMVDPSDPTKPGTTLSEADAAGFMSTILGGYVSALQSFTFNPDGTIALSYMKDDKVVNMPDNVTLKTGDLTYTMDDKAIYFAVKKDALKNMDPAISGIFGSLPGIQDLGTSYALPLLYTKNGTKLTVYVTKEMMLPYMGIVTSMCPAEFKPFVQGFVGMISASTQFDLGIKLELK